MAFGFLIIAAPPTLIWLAQLFTPGRTLINEDNVSGYFFGVLAGIVALAVAR